MSDEELNLPSDSKIETALRQAVQNVFKQGDLETLTVKRIRNAAVEELRIPSDFLRTDEKWKIKSKKVIEGESELQYQKAETSTNGANGSELASSSHRDEENKEQVNSDPSDSKKRRRGEAFEAIGSNSSKRQKSESPSPESSALSEVPSEGASDSLPALTTVPKDPKKKSKLASKGDESNEGKQSRNEAESDSELSVLQDDDPAPQKRKRRRRKDEGSKDIKSSKAKSSQSKAPADSKLSLDEAEIKRLQSNLLKCGIRKLWHKELAPYNTSKAKINHLRDMLKDVGMDGRFSAEKAAKIKEERELRAEVEAIQTESKRWGNEEANEDEEAAQPGKPRRRLALGLKELSFLGDEDGEEESD